MPRYLDQLVAVLCVAVLAGETHAGSRALDVFTRRILPIMNSAKPSSCAEFHLSGVDLKDYIRADQAETFAALVKGGLIDAKQPKKSKLLEFINRKGKLWQHSLSITAPRDSARARELIAKPTLPSGKYLVKSYVDQTGRLEKDWQYRLGDKDIVGQIEIDSKWPGGYGSMTAAKFPGR